MLSVCEEIGAAKRCAMCLKIRYEWNEKKPEDPKYVCLFDDDR